MTIYHTKWNTDQMCQRILSYTYYANIGICGYIYSFKPNHIFMIDTVGNYFLSIASNKFHYAEYLFLQNNKEIDYLSKDIIHHYMDDITWIHLRSALCLVVNCYPTPHMWLFCAIALMNHAICVKHFYSYMIGLLVTKDSFIDNKEPNNLAHMSITQTFVRFPIFVDSIIIIFNTENVLIRVGMAVITLVLGLLLYIEPFYKLNHILFHFGLWGQTYVLCWANYYNNM